MNSENHPGKHSSTARWTLAGRRALVTGGSAGIGRAVAESLLEFGAEVLIAARSIDGIDSCTRQWQAGGHPASGVAADVSTPQGREAICDAIERRWGALDLLINNAGTNVRKATVDYTPSEYQRLIETNQTSAFDLCRRCHPWLADAEQAAVVQVSSVAGLTHLSTGSPYGMTKAALIQLARNLAVEWASQGIRVNAVAPWYTDTPLAEPVLSQPERKSRILERTPLGRVAQPEEVAAAVVFLCLPAASFITGQCLAVDGGFMAYGY